MFTALFTMSNPGAHLGGGREDTPHALKKKSVYEQDICPENAL